MYTRAHVYAHTKRARELRCIARLNDEAVRGIRYGSRDKAQRDEM